MGPEKIVPIDIERKLALYRCHRSQLRAMRSEEAVADLAKRRGRQSGESFAEGFWALRISRPEFLRLGLRSPTVGGE